MALEGLSEGIRAPTDAVRGSQDPIGSRPPLLEGGPKRREAGPKARLSLHPFGFLAYQVPPVGQPPLPPGEQVRAVPEAVLVIVNECALGFVAFECAVIT